METLECTSQVRRSARGNRYKGFRPQNLSDAKAVKSKVKPRKIPEVPRIAADDEMMQTNVQKTEIPEDTPIPVLQAIGINLCGVPLEELSEEKLMDSPQNDKSEDKA